MLPPRRLIADETYDVARLRSWLEARGIKAVIPSTGMRTAPYLLDRVAHRQRTLTGRFFCRLKN